MLRDTSDTLIGRACAMFHFVIFWRSWITSTIWLLILTGSSKNKNGGAVLSKVEYQPLSRSNSQLTCFVPVNNFTYKYPINKATAAPFRRKYQTHAKFGLLSTPSNFVFIRVIIHLGVPHNSWRCWFQAVHIGSGNNFAGTPGGINTFWHPLFTWWEFWYSTPSY